MTKTTIQADAPIQECINDVLSVPREKFLNIRTFLTTLLKSSVPMSRKIKSILKRIACI